MNLLKIITPTNLKAERKKFLKDDSYDPIFSYSWQSNKPSIIVKGNKSYLIQSICNQDLALISKYSKIYFNINEFDYLDIANERISNKATSIPVETLDDFVNRFNQAFKDLELNEYKISIVEDEGFNFRPSTKTKEVVMSRHANFQFFDAEGEVRHELVHIIRYENGNYSKINNSKNYLPTEEGLATFMQDTSINGATSEFQHAAEYVASSIGINGSLRDVFNYFISIGFNKDLAWQRASRHKFGFTDTKKPGDILKPAMYFANSQKIKNLTNNEILRLFSGKISLDDLNNYKEYSGIIKEEKLKKFYNLI